MMGLNGFRCACILHGGIELLHTIAKGQMQTGGSKQTPAAKFYSLMKYGILFALEHFSPQSLNATKLPGLVGDRGMKVD